MLLAADGQLEAASALLIVLTRWDWRVGHCDYANAINGAPTRRSRNRVGSTAPVR